MSNSEEKKINFPTIPKGKDYEDYVASLIAAGYFLERGIHCWIDTEELLELDIIATNYTQNNNEKKLIEIKSGDWGYSDILKVYGWMNFLNIPNAAFVVQKAKDNPYRMITKKTHCKDLFNIDLIVNQEDDTTQKLDNNEILDTFKLSNDQAKYNYIYRIAFGLEAEMLLYLHKEIKEIDKKNKDNIKNNKPDLVIENGLKKIEDYYREINSISFFCKTDIERIKTLFESFQKYSNLSAKISKYLITNVYDDNCKLIESSIFTKTFFEADEISPMYVSLYTEFISRLELLKTCVSDVVSNKKKTMLEYFIQSSMPQNITNMLNKIEHETYSYKYPLFWQVFIYLFGGFILEPEKEKEYELLSKLTGIPITEIDNALECFDILFPIGSEKKWLRKIANTNILAMTFFPIPLHGTGVFFRALLYKETTGNSEMDYLSYLEKKYNDHSVDNMRKWVLLEAKFLELNNRLES